VKVPIDGYNCIDLDVPVLPAESIRTKSGKRWPGWCKHREVWHVHGGGDGHREAHCNDSSSPYWRSGYNLAESVG